MGLRTFSGDAPRSHTTLARAKISTFSCVQSCLPFRSGGEEVWRPYLLPSRIWPLEESSGDKVTRTIDFPNHPFRLRPRRCCRWIFYFCVAVPVSSMRYATEDDDTSRIHHGVLAVAKSRRWIGRLVRDRLPHGSDHMRDEKPWRGSSSFSSERMRHQIHQVPRPRICHRPGKPSCFVLIG